MAGFWRRALLVCGPLPPRFAPAAPICRTRPVFPHDRISSEPTFRAASLAISSHRLPTAAPSRALSSDAESHPLRARRRALLLAASRFDGDVGQLLLAFIQQHSSQCLEAEISELERVMQLSLDDLTALVQRPGAHVARPHLTWDNGMLQRFLSFARFCNGSEEFR